MRAIILAVLALAMAGPASGQALTREDLVQALRERDAAIAALEKRIAALETERGAPTPAQAQTEPPPAPGPAAAAGAPGADEIALQALSRSLVQKGGLVLPAGGVEVIPSLAYSHSLVQGLVLADTPEGISTVTDQRKRTDVIQSLMALRVGLPWASQIEVRVPYGWIRQANALGDGTHTTHEDAAFGDIEAELAHQFFRESGWRPDLVGAVSWRAPTGRDPFRAGVPAVASGAGVHQLGFRVTAVKSADPMVFFTTLSYGANLPRREPFGRVRVGDVIDWQTGAVLAVSPDTSLSLALAQDFRARTRVDGRPIAGSDGVASVAQIGIDQILSSRVLLDVTLGIGLTKDAPDYVFKVSLPIRLR